MEIPENDELLKWYLCTRKKFFRSWKAAEDHLHSMIRRRGSHNLKIYHCEYGRHFHVGHIYVPKNRKRVKTNRGRLIENALAAWRKEFGVFV